MIHEFIADEKAISDGDTDSFSAMLLKTAYPQHSFALTNSFFHSPIKRRLIMFTTSKKPSYSYLRRLMFLPLLILVIVFFAFKSKDKESYKAGNNLVTMYTVVIDAGHGGNDDGALGANGLKEKDITLALARLVKEENTNDNIKIVLSRENDAFLSPPQRIQLLEKIKPDLFISLHVNNTSEEIKESKENRGPETNIPKVNSALMQQSKILGSILSTNLEPVFNKQAVLKQKEQTIWVLDANKICPSVLLECGYLSNSADMSLLSKKDKQKQIAQMLLKTIDQYLSLKESTVSTSSDFGEVVVINESIKGDNTSDEGTDTTIKIKDASGRVVKMITSERINTKTNATDTPDLPKALLVLDTNGFGRLLPKKVIAAEQIKEMNVLKGKSTIEKYGEIGRLLPKKVIAAEQIKEMNVLKGKLTIEKYGEKGANGVAEITTVSQGIVDKSAKEDSQDPTKPKFDKVFTKVENPPYYSKGMAAFADYIQNNIQYPKEAIENKKEGAVSIKFIIDENGNLSHFEKASDGGFGLEEEAIRLLKNSTDWKPGTQNGHKVPVEIVQQIIFRLPKV